MEVLVRFSLLLSTLFCQFKIRNGTSQIRSFNLIFALFVMNRKLRKEDASEHLNWSSRYYTRFKAFGRGDQIFSSIFPSLKIEIADIFRGQRWHFDNPTKVFLCSLTNRPLLVLSDQTILKASSLIN